MTKVIKYVNMFLWLLILYACVSTAIDGRSIPPFVSICASFVCFTDSFRMVLHENMDRDYSVTIINKKKEEDISNDC